MQNKGGYIPDPQLDGNKNINFETSTSTSTITLPVLLIGERVNMYLKLPMRFLKNRKNITTIGVAFSFQKYNKLPVSRLDIKLDYILTEKGLRK